MQGFCTQKSYGDINNIIEFHNIKQYFDNEIHLERWQKAELDNYKNTVSNFAKIIAVFFKGITDDIFLQLIQEVDVSYRNDFWKLIDKYKIYKKISQDVFLKAINTPYVFIRDVLIHKKIVQKYGQIIADYLLNAAESAKLLLGQYIDDFETRKTPLFFPDELTIAQKESIICNYIESKEANPNYLKLITELNSSSKLKLQDKTKLLAKKKYEQWTSPSFYGSSGLRYGIEIAFSSTQKEICIAKNKEDNTISISYNKKWIEENLDFPTLLNNFIYFFGYTDINFRSQFVSQTAYTSLIDRFGVKGANSYNANSDFCIKNMIFKQQMSLYYDFLRNLDIKLEEVFKWFFEEYLIAAFGASGFIFSAPTDSTNYSEKCVLLAREIDSILKQFSLFVNNGCINRELFEISSKHIVFKDVPSFCAEKYIYPKGDICKGCMNLLFSDQSILAYVSKEQKSYDNFFSILLKGSLKLNDFEISQKERIKWLEKQECITINESGVLMMNEEKIFILRDLYYNQVSCIKYLNKFDGALSLLKNQGEIQYEASLFSKPEQDYLNFMLNKSEFGNGYDLRNKYMHGTTSKSPEINKNDYIEFLKIMVLVIIKINEEFCLREVL